jgi:hypothetical protein
MLNKCDYKDRPSKDLLFKALESDRIIKMVAKLYVKETSAYNK